MKIYTERTVIKCTIKTFSIRKSNWRTKKTINSHQIDEEEYNFLKLNLEFGPNVQKLLFQKDIKLVLQNIKNVF